VVLVQEVVDPGDHLGRGEAVALVRAVDVVLDVEHAGQGAPVAGLVAAVVDEVVGLGLAARGVRCGVVVRAADEADVAGALELLRKVRTVICRAFSGFDVGEFRAVRLD
jgi:hypothetical protein